MTSLIVWLFMERRDARRKKAAQEEYIKNMMLATEAERKRIEAEAADAIIGTSLDDAALEALGAACSAACKPIDDKRGTVEYRVKVAGVLAQRAAKIAYERAGGK